MTPFAGALTDTCAQSDGRAFGACSLAHALPLLRGRFVAVLFALCPLHARQHVLQARQAAGDGAYWALARLLLRLAASLHACAGLPAQLCNTHAPNCPPAAHLLGLHIALQLQQLDDLALHSGRQTAENFQCPLQPMLLSFSSSSSR